MEIEREEETSTKAKCIDAVEKEVEEKTKNAGSKKKLAVATRKWELLRVESMFKHGCLGRTYWIERDKTPRVGMSIDSRC